MIPGLERSSPCSITGGTHALKVTADLRSHENKTTAEVHDYLDERTGVLAAMLAKRAPGYTGLGFPDPRKIALTPSASTGS